MRAVGVGDGVSPSRYDTSYREDEEDDRKARLVALGKFYKTRKRACLAEMVSSLQYSFDIVGFVFLYMQNLVSSTRTDGKRHLQGCSRAKFRRRSRYITPLCRSCRLGSVSPSRGPGSLVSWKSTTP